MASRASRLRLSSRQAGVAGLLLYAAIAASACGSSPPSRFYTLDAAAKASQAPALGAAVLVGPVSIPASVDRPQFVVQASPNRVDLDETNRWAAPLDDAIARAVAGDLTALLGTDVGVAPLVDFNAAYRVTINVQRFDSIQNEAAVVDAVWSVRKTAGGATRSGRTQARETTQGAGYEALAAAHSRALVKLSEDIAAAIREMAAAR